MKVLKLEQHHLLLALGLGPQLLHFYVNEAIDLLEEEDVLGVEVLLRPGRGVVSGCTCHHLKGLIIVESLRGWSSHLSGYRPD